MKCSHDACNKGAALINTSVPRSPDEQAELDRHNVEVRDPISATRTKMARAQEVFIVTRREMYVRVLSDATLM